MPVETTEQGHVGADAWVEVVAVFAGNVGLIGKGGGGLGVCEWASLALRWFRDLGRRVEDF